MKPCSVCNLEQRDTNDYCIRCGTSFLTLKRTPIPLDILKTKHKDTNPSTSIAIKIRPTAPHQTDLKLLEQFTRIKAIYDSAIFNIKSTLWVLLLIVDIVLFMFAKLNIAIIISMIALPILMYFAQNYLSHKLVFLFYKDIPNDFKAYSDHYFYHTLASSKDQYGNQQCVHCGCTKFYKEGEYNSSKKTYYCAKCKKYLFTIQ